MVFFFNLSVLLFLSLFICLSVSYLTLNRNNFLHFPLQSTVLYYSTFPIFAVLSYFTQLFYLTIQSFSHISFSTLFSHCILHCSLIFQSSVFSCISFSAHLYLLITHPLCVFLFFQLLESRATSCSWLGKSFHFVYINSKYEMIVPDLMLGQRVDLDAITLH